jgi:catechol 2,3-dioxygenase-like lactoylglutathione lyase family enzyme
MDSVKKESVPQKLKRAATERNVFDHISIGVRDLRRSASFYDAVLAPLGYVRLLTHEKAAGWGTPPGHHEPPFAVVQEPSDSSTGSTSMAHIAFKAPTRTAVVAFYEAALATGAESQHAPRLWAEYGPNYFAAFVGDPDGYNIEAVCHLG